MYRKHLKYKAEIEPTKTRTAGDPISVRSVMSQTQDQTRSQRNPYEFAEPLSEISGIKGTPKPEEHALYSMVKKKSESPNGTNDDCEDVEVMDNIVYE